GALAGRAVLGAPPPDRLARRPPRSSPRDDPPRAPRAALFARDRAGRGAPSAARDRLGPRPPRPPPPGARGDDAPPRDRPARPPPPPRRPRGARPARRRRPRDDAARVIYAIVRTRATWSGITFA